MSYQLVIDSGNTAIKWGVFDRDNWIDKGVIVQANRDSLKNAWKNIAVPSQITISNVAGSLVGQSLKSIFENLGWKVKVHWITAKDFQCGVSNSYSIPSQLGSDRWAALIASWKIRRQSCLVICVGTAMTVDVLSNNGEFMGGIITPGLDLMQNSLVNRTALLTQPNNGCFQALPRNTEDAMASGAIRALTGAIDQMYSLISDNLTISQPACIISGKGAQAILPYISIVSKEWVDDLVLEGLRIISLEDSSIVFEL